MAIKSFPISVTAPRVALYPWLGKVYGAENLPSSGSYIIAANHNGFLDGVALSVQVSNMTLKPLHMVSIDKPFKNWLFGWFLRSARMIPLKKASIQGTVSMMRLALGYLQMGEPVGIFPEAHPNESERLKIFRPGASILALEAGVPIVPVGIVGSEKVWPRGRKFFSLSEKIDINIGKPVDIHYRYGEYNGINECLRGEAVDELSSVIARNISVLCGKEVPRERRKRRQP